MKREMREMNVGITLVALVVTIVVLLILAGITLVYVLGDNSVFNQTSEAKLKTDIANWQERLEIAKNPTIIEGLGTFDLINILLIYKGKVLLITKIQMS